MLWGETLETSNLYITKVLGDVGSSILIKVLCTFSSCNDHHSIYRLHCKLLQQNNFRVNFCDRKFYCFLNISLIGWGVLWGMGNQVPMKVQDLLVYSCCWWKETLPTTLLCLVWFLSAMGFLIDHPFCACGNLHGETKLNIQVYLIYSALLQDFQNTRLPWQIALKYVLSVYVLLALPNPLPPTMTSWSSSIWRTCYNTSRLSLLAISSQEFFSQVHTMWHFASTTPQFTSTAALCHSKTPMHFISHFSLSPLTSLQ